MPDGFHAPFLLISFLFSMFLCALLFITTVSTRHFFFLWPPPFFLTPYSAVRYSPILFSTRWTQNLDAFFFFPANSVVLFSVGPQTFSPLSGVELKDVKSFPFSVEVSVLDTLPDRDLRLLFADFVCPLRTPIFILALFQWA